MSKYEDGLNDLANGKPFKTGGVIEKDFKPEYDKKDIESYRGQWALLFFEKSGAFHKSVDPLVYATQEGAQSDIDYVFRNKCDLSGRGNKLVKFEDLSHGFPIPVK